MRSPVRKSLFRKITWFGGDRRIVGMGALMLGMVCASLFFGYGFMYGLTVIGPGGCFMIILWIARQANASDPFMMDILLRQRRYKSFYAAKPSLRTEHPQIRDFS